MIKKKNILVTGGAGFVGSHLCKRLVVHNNVYVLDNYFTGSEKNHHKKVKYIKGENKNIFKIFKKKHLDYIFHLGEYSRVEQSFEDIDKVIEYNSNSIYEVIKLAYHLKAKLIYSGSSTKFAPKTSNYLLSPYAWSKLTNTSLINSFSKWKSLNYAITYFYNVYGSNEISNGKYATVIGKFLRMVKEGNKFLPVSKPGHQKRNFTHIDDIVDGLILVAAKGQGDGYGIGSQKAYSINQIVKFLNKKPKYYSSPRGNRMSASLKTNKIRKLGWVAKVNLYDYINRELKR